MTTIAIGVGEVRRAPLTTRTLMTCVAIALVGGMLTLGGSYLSVATNFVFPPAFDLMSGTIIFPAVIALRLLRLGGTGLLTTALTGLIGILAGPYGWGALAAAVPFGLLIEVPFVVNRYRRWTRWRHHLGALVAAAYFSTVSFVGFNYSQYAVWIQVLPLVVPALSMLAFTVLGIAAADRLRRAGVGPRTRVAAVEA